MREIKKSIPYWLSIFKDESKIFQYSDNKENPFSLVLEKINNLKEFILFIDYIEYKIDLIKGIIYKNNNILYDFFNFKDFKLVYFKRNFINIGYGFNNINHNYTYFLGLKYNNQFNTEKEFLIEIDLEGNYKIGNR